MRPCGLVLVCLSLLGGCATPPRVAAAPTPSAELRAIIANAATQVKRCYRGPRGLSREARRVTTVIGVRFNMDGSLASDPVIVSQSGVTPDIAFEAVQLGQAAITAAVRCSPLGLPPQLYANGWDSFELTFTYATAA